MLLGGGHAKGTLRRLGGACYGPSLPRRPHATVRPRRHTVRNALGPDQLDALSTGLQHLQHLLTLAYEPVVLPCSSLNCGDVMHRSTLDPVLRMEQQGVNPLGLGMLGAALAYLSVKPGVLMGALDYYLLARLQRMSAKAYSKDDFVLGKKLASGGFGTVYLAELVDPDTRERRKVVVKKAKEFGEAEVWMNERMMRVAPNAAAEFITGFSDGDAKEGEPLWLVWAYEGDCTLADLIQKKDFPTAAEPLLFGRPLNIPPGPERKAAVIRLILQQLLECLAACHAVGIVHRDVKPQNLILSSVGQLKLIDFGAAADLRIGINYVPNQYLLDMRYAPPQQYIMSKYTPRAPSKPLAALLSPVLWNLFHPDRFDMYSVGITLLQMACPNLRNDNGLIAFNKQLAEQYNYDLRRWRRAVEASPKLTRDWAEGFAILDCDGGAGWDLACQLVQYEPVHRLSCEQALSHRWFATTGMASLASVASNITAQVSQLTRLEHLTTTGRLADIRRLADVEASWLEQRLAPAGTKKGGGLTEAFLEEELSDHPAREEPPMTEYPSNTIAWWQGRQSALQRRLGQRKLQLAAGLARLGRTIAGGGAGAGAHLASNGSWKGQANNGGGGGGGSRAVNGVNGNGKGSLGKLAAAGANGGSNGLANGGGNGNGAGAGGNRNGAGGKVRVQLQKKNAKDLIGAKR